MGLGHMARQEFARGMHRHVALSRESLHGALLQGMVSGHGKSSGAGEVDGAKVWGMAHHCQAPHGHGTATQGCTWR